MGLRFTRYELEGSKICPPILCFILACSLASTMTLGCKSEVETQLTTVPLSGEQLQVYGDFLDIFSSRHFRRLADQTAPFLSSDLPQGSPCIQGIELENPSVERRVLHQFGSEITHGSPCTSIVN
jgi:hypothetical protein